MHSDDEFQHILTNHSVDETFVDRVRNEALTRLPNGTPDTAIPARLWLKIAKQTRLYMLVHAESDRYLHMIEVALNPQNDLLVVAEGDCYSTARVVKIWDLKTKQCLHSCFYQESARNCYTTRIFFFGNLIAVCSHDAVRVYSHALELLRLLRFEVTGSYVKHGERLLGIFLGRIVSFDVNVDGGDPQEVARIPRDGREAIELRYEELVAICDDQWLIVNVQRTYLNQRTRFTATNHFGGVYVIDISTGFAKQFLRGSNCGMTHSFDPRKFFARKPNQKWEKLELDEEGIISCKGRLPYLSGVLVSGWPHCSMQW